MGSSLALYSVVGMQRVCYPGRAFGRRKEQPFYQHVRSARVCHPGRACGPQERAAALSPYPAPDIVENVHSLFSPASLFFSSMTLYDCSLTFVRKTVTVIVSLA